MKLYLLLLSLPMQCLFKKILNLSLCLLAAGCIKKGSNVADPYETINRKTHSFNMQIDKFVLKPAAKVYNAIIPPPVRKGINNAYNNVNMLPSVANDLLQADFNDAIKDTWRFLINSTMGIAGIFDVASSMQLPPHSNDLGITFAKWGDKNSPYIVIPFMGPSTIRDGFGMMFDFAIFTPYPYIPSSAAIYGILGFRYVDLRAQMLETDAIIGEAIDEYAFIRDAYLQHRNYLINGETTDSSSSLYVDESAQEEANKGPTLDSPEKPSKFPITTN